MSGLADLAFWRHLRGTRTLATPPDPVAPPGDGPLVLICGPSDAMPGLAGALRRLRPGLRLGALGPVAVDRGDPAVPQVLPEPPPDAALSRRLLAALDPAALVLTDGAVPAALVFACDDAGVPVTLVAGQIPRAPATQRGLWHDSRARSPVTRIARVLVPDRATRAEALRLGLAPARVDITGPLSPVIDPPPVNRPEAEALRPLMHARPVWLAAALPLAEADAVLDAHAALLTARHRALLLIAPADPAEAEAIASTAEARGLSVARRERDEEPGPGVQVMVAGDAAELGLWYRLAPVTFMGGTLAGGGAARHPFEPAGLGSAIIHGPATGEHGAEWTALDRARAARKVANAAALRPAVEDLTAPDQAAALAHAAWTVATDGAAVIRRIAEAVLSDLPEARG
ncbi:glycosyltransferase N-terminal domain-containing protein [Paracoccus luteus]|uniref:glycosyltransferase N-terminal domain-containing protein n=1 Tax=Paracoccus luteus TaxID=2508543 RepID=UPI0010703777|nr:glycosyltransferase N-terminal domain-containing protein [Paracoccus luteus]